MSIFVKADPNLESVQDSPRFVQPILSTLGCVMYLLLILHGKTGPQDPIPVDYSILAAIQDNPVFYPVNTAHSPSASMLSCPLNLLLLLLYTTWVPYLCIQIISLFQESPTPKTYDAPMSNYSLHAGTSIIHLSCNSSTACYFLVISYHPCYIRSLGSGKFSLV